MTEIAELAHALEPIEDIGGAAQPLLQVSSLTKHFPVRGGLFAPAVLLQPFDDRLRQPGGPREDLLLVGRPFVGEHARQGPPERVEISGVVGLDRHDQLRIARDHGFLADLGRQPLLAVMAGDGRTRQLVRTDHARRAHHAPRELLGGERGERAHGEGFFQDGRELVCGLDQRLGVGGGRAGANDLALRDGTRRGRAPWQQQHSRDRGERGKRQGSDRSDCETVEDQGRGLHRELPRRLAAVGRYRRRDLCG